MAGRWAGGGRRTILAAEINRIMPITPTMQRRLLAPNLTAVLAVSALGELIFYRVLNAAFLPAQPSTVGQRLLVDLGSFLSNLSGILALVLAVGGLIRALNDDTIFPRSMRITVSTVGLFFSALAAMGVLWLLVTPRYQIHLRISHGFLVFFLMLGLWRGPTQRMQTSGAGPAWPARLGWRCKLGVTLFAVPMVMEALALFAHRMAWARVDPAHIICAAHVLTWAAMCATPILLAPRIRTAGQLAAALGAGILLGAGLGAVTALRFDLVQAVAFYGLRIDLTGLSSSAEQLYVGALVLAAASLAAATVACLAVRGPSRLVGWGLLLMAVAGEDLSSAKAALFSLCALLALAVGSAQAQPHSIPANANPA